MTFMELLDRGWDAVFYGTIIAASCFSLLGILALYMEKDKTDALNPLTDWWWIFLMIWGCTFVALGVAIYAALFIATYPVIIPIALFVLAIASGCYKLYTRFREWRSARQQPTPNE